jgi:hypothetical protein
MSNPNPVRISAGLPTGGQFAADPHAEAEEELDGSISAVPLAELAIPMGTALQVDDYDSGSNVFSGIEVTPSRDQPGFDVVGMVPMDFREGLCAGMSEEDSDRYLNAHSTQIEAFLAEHYDAGLEGGDSWDEQSATFTAQLPVEARTDQLLESLEVSTKAVDLHNATNGAQLHGFYGELRTHLDDRDRIGRDTASVADRLGVAPGEKISSRHPDFTQIAGTSWVVQGSEDYDDTLEHSVGVYHHLPSGRLVAAETTGSISDYNSDGAGDPHGSDLYEITSTDQLAKFRSNDRALVGQHLAEVPVVDDADHLTVARVEQRITAGLPRGVKVSPGGVRFTPGSFGREVPGARGPAAADVQLSVYLENGSVAYSTFIEGGVVKIARRNAFGAFTLGETVLSDGTPAGVGRAVTEALAQSDRKEQQRAALVGGLRSRLPVSYEPPFHEEYDGSFGMVVAVPRRGTPGQSSAPRTFGVQVTAEGQVTVAKKSLVDGAAPLDTRISQMPAGSNFTAATDHIVSAINDMKA